MRLTEELALKRAPAPNAPQAQAGGDGMYQYTGADGSTHFVMGLAQVPKKYRKSAAPVESEIDTVQSATMPRPSAPAKNQPEFITNNAPWPPPYALPQAGMVQQAQGNDDHMFGLPGPAGQAVKLQEEMRRTGNRGIPNTSPPPALPPKPPGSAYIQPPSPYK